MSNFGASQFIDELGLERHPEGGWFRETYRAKETVSPAALPQQFNSERSFCTAIYFLLEKGTVSALHRIKSDELWHFYAGARLTIHVITPEGDYWSLLLGADLPGGDSFQAVVPAGCWFGTELSGEGDFSLVGCTVAPGFDFADFALGTRAELQQQFPAHTEIIQRLTKG